MSKLKFNFKYEPITGKPRAKRLPSWMDPVHADPMVVGLIGWTIGCICVVALIGCIAVLGRLLEF